MKKPLLVAAIASGICVHGIADAALYNVIPLASGMSGASSPVSLNDFGQIAITVNNGIGPSGYRGAVNGLTSLGALSVGGNTAAFGINNHGDVVGNSDTDSNGSHAFLWSNGSMTDLGTLGGSSSAAYGINDSRQVVGQSRAGSIDPVTGFVPERAFLWSNGSMTDLGTLGGRDSVAQAINNASQVTGFAYTGTAFHAFLWTSGSMQDLGTLGGTDSYGYAMNDSGQVAGWSAINQYGHNHAFFWSQENGMLDIGTLGGTTSSAMGMNNLGQVVGVSSTDQCDPCYAFDQRAFIWTAAGGLVDLNSLVDSSSDWTIIGAMDINEVGQIAAIGYSPNGSYQAVLLSPVPEPKTYAMFLAALGLIGSVMYRRQGRQDRG